MAARTQDLFVDMKHRWPQYGPVEEGKEYIKVTFCITVFRCASQLLASNSTAVQELQFCWQPQRVLIIRARCRMSSPGVQCTERMLCLAENRSLYWLANAGSYKAIGKTFALAQSTVFVILHETVKALDDITAPSFKNQRTKSIGLMLCSLLLRIFSKLTSHNVLRCQKTAELT